MLIQGEKDFFFPGLSYSVTEYGSDRSLTSWWPHGSTSPGAFLERQKVTFTQGRDQESQLPERPMVKPTAKFTASCTPRSVSVQRVILWQPQFGVIPFTCTFRRCRWPTGKSWIKTIPRLISHCSEEAGSSILHKEQLLGPGGEKA